MSSLWKFNAPRCTSSFSRKVSFKERARIQKYTCRCLWINFLHARASSHSHFLFLQLQNSEKNVLNVCSRFILHVCVFRNLLVLVIVYLLHSVGHECIGTFECVQIVCCEFHMCFLHFKIKGKLWITHVYVYYMYINSLHLIFELIFKMLQNYIHILLTSHSYNIKYIV